MKLKINVTKECIIGARFCGLVDIDGNPVPSNSTERKLLIQEGKIIPVKKSCAIALAILPLFPSAEVGGAYIHFDPTLPQDSCSRLPDSAMVFIKIFDSLTPVERVSLPPFRFEIDVPEELIDSINIDQVKRIDTLELVG